MILEYHRPANMEKALGLLARTDPRTVPLAGGTFLTRPSAENIAVVDLQSLGLNQITERGKSLEIGAAVKLQTLLEWKTIPPALGEAIRKQEAYNLRNMASTAGSLICADGRSPFAAAMLALDAQLSVLPAPPENAIPQVETFRLGSMLPIRADALAHRLITAVVIPLNIRLAFEYVARTPADSPIVCASVAIWPSGRTRVVLGGYGGSPLLAMDGPNSTGAEIAARAAYHEAGDQWASAGYRREIAAVLAERCVKRLGSNK